MGNAGRAIATLVALGIAGAATAAEEAPRRTVVTLGFDDARATQVAALPILAEFGMRASFFINSGNVGTTGYLDYARLADIQAAGHELGGHTMDHDVLTTVSKAEAKHQVCDDRVALEAAGLKPLVSFAYPGGATDPEIEAIVAGCGYTHAWAQGWIDKENCTKDCMFAESLEPPDKLRLRSPLSVTGDWSLKDLQGFVLRAEQQGGWLGLTFHHVCDDCNYNYRITPALLHDFLAWLAPRAAAGTVVLPLSEAFEPPGPDDSGTDPTPPDPGTAPAPKRISAAADPVSAGGPEETDGCSSAGPHRGDAWALALVGLALRGALPRRRRR